MFDETLAVVDEHDNVIDHRPRYEIHAQGLRHRAVHILVFNHRGELLLQKRSMHKDLNKGLWDTSAAGHVDQGESYDDCAPRELREELGVDAALTPLFKLSPTPGLGMEFIQVFSACHNGPFVFAEQEIDELAWQTPDDVDRRVLANDASLTQTFRIIWRQFRGLTNADSTR